MKKLIIAEKPAQAKDYADALGNFIRKEGYFESDKSYITWCFGHLIELERDEVYREKGSWNKSYLPLLPKKFKYCIGKDNKGKTDTGKKKQLDVIKKLADYSSEIINATDADREGELIFLYIYNFLKLKIPYRRLWISSLTKGDIQNGFRNLLSAKDVENLGKSGYARAVSDWLVGINGTQAATLQFGDRNLLTIGRVQNSILKIICERYLKNKNFVPSYSYKIKAEHRYNGINYSSATEIFESKEEVDSIIEKLDEFHLFKENINTKKKVTPPLLHSIDTLIVEANQIFGYSGKDTLSIAQTLYEKKLTTYPRTDSNYINEENYEKMKGYLVFLTKEVVDISFSFGQEKPKSVNVKKLTGSHDAIIPTGELSNYSSLNERERNIFELVIRKCLESFSESAIYDKNKYVFINKGIEFFTYTSNLIKEGWKAFSFQKEEEAESDELLLKIELKENEKVRVEQKNVVKIESKPPALYTDANLTPDLINIGKFLKEENPQLLDELKDKIDLSDIQLGTQATRPLIIERLKKIDFIGVQKKKYVPTEKGLKYYNTIKSLKVSNIANTAILEKELKDIAEGRLSETQFYGNLETYVRSIVDDIFEIKAELKINKRISLGECPQCKEGNIVEGKKAFGCDKYKEGCKFVIWKDVSGKTLTEKDIKDLISKKKTKIIKGFISKIGKKFDARIILDSENNTKFSFE